MIKNIPPVSRGFTLIEMSIILVIIGLLVGGVMVGKDMLRSSQIIKIMPEIDKVGFAVQRFKDKYQYLPGDMPDATSLWGAVVGDCNYVAGTGTQTCNGNSDGWVGLPVPNEAYRFWQHLALSELYPNTLTPISASAQPGTACWMVPTMCALPGFNVPASPFGDGTGYNIQYAVAVPMDNPSWAQYMVPQSGSVMTMGRSQIGLLGSMFTPLEALNFDTKFDDGLPRAGKIMGATPAGLPGCYNGMSGFDFTRSANTPQWGGSDSSVECSPFVVMGW